MYSDCVQLFVRALYERLFPITPLVLATQGDRWEQQGLPQTSNRKFGQFTRSNCIQVCGSLHFKDMTIGGKGKGIRAGSYRLTTHCIPDYTQTIRHAEIKGNGSAQVCLLIEVSRKRESKFSIQ